MDYNYKKVNSYYKTSFNIRRCYKTFDFVKNCARLKYFFLEKQLLYLAFAELIKK